MIPNNSNVIWVGSGENNNQRSASYGDGVYKSTDGGKTWKNMGLKNSEHTGMIKVDPKNSDIVYVAAYGPCGVKEATEVYIKLLMGEKHGKKY
jgi:photosystem II stability/assembly factor-like uncharacterized protein